MIDKDSVQKIIDPTWRRGSIYISFDEYKVILTGDVTEVHSGGITENVKLVDSMWRSTE